MEAHVVQGRAGPPGGVVGPAQAVLQEVAEKLLRALPVGARDVGPADAGGGKRPLEPQWVVVVRAGRLMPVTDWLLTLP